jgi:hypothetical protein
VGGRRTPNKPSRKVVVFPSLTRQEYTAIPYPPNGVYLLFAEDFFGCIELEKVEKINKISSAITSPLF